MKIRIHFNRVNMQRGDDRVWSAHTSKACNMSEKIIVKHQGKTILETVFKKGGRQPRAHLVTSGTVTTHADGLTVVEVV